MKIFRYLFVSMLAVLSLVMTVSAASDKVVTPNEPVALFIQLDPTGVAKPIEQAKEIHKSVAKELALVNKEPIAFEQTQKMFRIYLRDNDTSSNQREQDMGMIMRTKDLKALAEKAGTRYVLFVSSRITNSEVKDNFWTGKRKNMTVLSSILVYDTLEEKYLVDEEFESVGTTTGSFERAYNRAIQEMLEKVDFSAALKPVVKPYKPYFDPVAFTMVGQL